MVVEGEIYDVDEGGGDLGSPRELEGVTVVIGAGDDVVCRWAGIGSGVVRNSVFCMEQRACWADEV